MNLIGLIIMIIAVSSCQKTCKMYGFDIYAYKEGSRCKFIDRSGDSVYTIQIRRFTSFSLEERDGIASSYFDDAIHDSVITQNIFPYNESCD